MNHNSDQGPNGHGYRREESVEIEPVVKRVLEAAREGKIEKKDMALLKKEFARMAAAAPVIRARANNPRLMKEIGAWVDAFEQLGHAGQHAVAALEETTPEKPRPGWCRLRRLWRPWMEFPAATTRKDSCIVLR